MSSALRFHEVYPLLLSWVMLSPGDRNRRTGREIKVGEGGTSFRVDLSDGLLPVCGTRKLFPKSAAAEVAWYLSGEQDVTWMRRHAPLWDKFVEADGVTVKTAYGYRWREHFGRDQIALALEALRDDPSDRRVMVSAWDPATDGLGAVGQRNVPCPSHFTLSVLRGRLHSSLFKRSTDVVVGLPYDVMGHALLMEALAVELGLRPGIMQVTMAHPHIYEDHYEIAATCATGDQVVPRLNMPGWSVSQVEADRDGYVAAVRGLADAVAWNPYSPKPFVVE